jgi:hypothetical protein
MTAALIVVACLLASALITLLVGKVIAHGQREDL